MVATLWWLSNVGDQGEVDWFSQVCWRLIAAVEAIEAEDEAEESFLESALSPNALEVGFFVESSPSPIWQTL